MVNKTGLPGGVSWEDSPLFDFGKRPVLTLLPDLARLLTVGYLVRLYGGTDAVDKKVDVLDVAAGFGELSQILKVERKGRGTRLRYVGIDIDPRKKERAKTLMPGIDYRMANLEKEGALLGAVGEERFDVVASTETLEHMAKPHGERFLADCLSLLKPGGTFIMTSANPSIHRTNEWHLYEWPVQELRDWCRENAKVVDWFYLKGPSPVLRDRFPKQRAPAEMLRMLPNPSEGSVTVVVLRPR